MALIKIDDNFKDAILAYRDVNDMDLPHKYYNEGDNPLYGNLMFNKETGEIWNTEHYHNSWSVYDDDNIINLSADFMENDHGESLYPYTYDGVKECIEDNFPNTYDFPPDKEPVYKTGYLIQKVMYKMPFGCDTDNYGANQEKVKLVETDVEYFPDSYNTNFYITADDARNDFLNATDYSPDWQPKEEIKYEKRQKMCYFTQFEVQEVAFEEYSGQIGLDDYDPDVIRECYDFEPIFACAAMEDNLTGRDVFSFWNPAMASPSEKTVYLRDAYDHHHLDNWEEAEHEYNIAVSDGGRVDIYEPETQPETEAEANKLVADFTSSHDNVQRNFSTFRYVGTMSENQLFDLDNHYNYGTGKEVETTEVGKLEDLLKTQEEEKIQTQEHKAPAKHR